MNFALMSQELIQDEGMRTKPYKDTRGFMTIGVGRNIDSKGITEEEAKFMLANDIGEVVRGLDRVLPWWRDQDEARQRVLVNLGFNMGLSGLLQFTQTLAAFQRKDYKAAGKGLRDSLWYTQVGQRGPRLVKVVEEGE